MYKEGIDYIFSNKKIDWVDRKKIRFINVREKKMETKIFDKKKLLFLFLPFAVIIIYDIIGNFITGALFWVLDLFRISFDWVNNTPAFLDAFLATCLSIILYIFYRKVFPRKKAEIRIAPWQGLLFSVVIGFGAGGLSTIWLNLVDLVASHFSALGEQAEAFSSMYDDLEKGSYIWTFLAIVAIGPLVEEILFRGVIFRSFEEATDLPWFPLLLSGVMFGIWHGSFIQAVYTAMMGIILGYYIKKTRTLFYVVLAHAVNNLSGTLPPALDTDFNNSLITVLSYVCIIPMFCILYYLHRQGKMQAEEISESEQSQEEEAVQFASSTC